MPANTANPANPSGASTAARVPRALRAFDLAVVGGAALTLFICLRSFPPAPAALPALCFLALANQALCLAPYRVATGRITFNDAALAAAALLSPGTGAFALAALANWKSPRTAREHVVGTAISTLAVTWSSIAVASGPQVPFLRAVGFGALYLVFETALTALAIAARTGATPLDSVTANLTWRTLTLQASTLLAGGIVSVLLVDASGYAFSAALLLTPLALRSYLRDQQRLRDLWTGAMHDPLTGLLNRRGLEDALARRSAVRGGLGAAAVCIFDIDHFKAINDRFGHSAGDEVLRVMGAVLREAVRTSDITARLGGEEFCVVLPGADAGEAAEVAERARRSFAEASLAADRAATVSAGIVAVRRVTEVAPLFELADGALYAAKADGRDRLVIAEAAV